MECACCLGTNVPVIHPTDVCVTHPTCSLCICSCLCVQTTVTDQLNSSPGWFDPSHWAGDEKPKLSLSTEHTRQWADLVERTEKIAQVRMCVLFASPLLFDIV